MQRGSSVNQIHFHQDSKAAKNISWEHKQPWQTVFPTQRSTNLFFQMLPGITGSLRLLCLKQSGVTPSSIGSALQSALFCGQMGHLWRVTKLLSQRHWVGRYEHVPWACWKGAGFGVVIRMWRKEGMGDPLGLTSGLANTLPDAQASPSTYSYLSFSTCKTEQWYWSHLWSALRFTKKNALDGYYSHLST